MKSAGEKENQALNRLRKSYNFFNLKIFRLLYSTFVRPHLEFKSAVWNLMTKGDINKTGDYSKKN